ncbi:glycoside hydrolase family 12 protein [Podospora aff. communis PSN243]|uniref:Glycoside hydrolase family 12 protein n=1 Tax=Podospora aff. communis PSN243 TaxID=3040156 RepID=A0AAV9GCB4_9PEZI|nr:glycoside hydrolase family 12 protein [Podospora aff. communis PSN243]
MKSSLVFLAQLATLATSAAIEPRQQATLCKQYEYWSGNGYEMNNNLWGKDAASSGSQCTYLNSASANGISWSSTWTWQGAPNNVKSYVYAGRQVTRGRKISQISSMPTSVSWQYNTNVRANVAYDIFTAADPNHVNSSGDYELMIWLGRFDVYPIGSNTGMVSVGGRQWELWIGYNGAMKVFSFIAPQTTNQWSGDAKQFFQYLQDRQGFPASSQNLIVYQFGTEAFTGGPATFTVSNWSASVN